MLDLEPIKGRLAAADGGKYHGNASITDGQLLVLEVERLQADLRYAHETAQQDRRGLWKLIETVRDVLKDPSVPATRRKQLAESLPLGVPAPMAGSEV